MKLEDLKVGATFICNAYIGVFRKSDPFTRAGEVYERSYKVDAPPSEVGCPFYMMGSTEVTEVSPTEVISILNGF
jgi:hypothetical protein